MRRTALALAFAALLGIAAQLLLYGHLLGVNAPVVVAIFLVLAWRLRRRPIDPLDAWIPLSAFTFASLLAIRTEPAVVVFDVIATIGLCLASAAALGARITRVPITSLVVSAIATAGAAMTAALALIRLERAHPDHPGRVGRVAPYAAGLGIAAPLLGVFTILFASADEVFAHTIREALGPDALRVLPARLVLASVVAWIAAGTFTMLWREPSVASDLPRPVRRETAAVLLVLVDLVFALFAGIEITYLFGGSDTVRAAGITYSAYARRGFFELVGAAAIVAGLLFALDVFVERGRRAHVVPALVLVALTDAILVSAFYRLDLYQQAYGWSELRFYAIAAIAFLALALSLLAWALVAGRMSHAVQPVVLAAVIVAIGVNAIGPSPRVARPNLARAIDPGALPADAERTLDLLYLYRLGDAAVPVLVDALPVLPERERSCLEALLRWQLLSRRDLEATVDWRSWNADRARATEAMRSFASSLADAPRDDHVADARRTRQLANAFQGCRA